MSNAFEFPLIIGAHNNRGSIIKHIDGIIEYFRFCTRALDMPILDNLDGYESPSPVRFFYTPEPEPEPEPEAISVMNPQIKNLKQSGLVSNLKETGQIKNLKQRGSIKWL